MSTSEADDAEASAARAPFAFEWLASLGAGELSSVELCEHYLDRVASVNPALNAVASIDPEQVLDHARAADSARRAGSDAPLLGLPVTVKDNIEVAGLPCASGTWGRREHRPESDAEVVRRLRRAGAVVLAKTSLPELASSFETDNAIIGRTNHPLDPTRTPGGSSGGEAALLAADASPIGVGTDGGGSIRVPSHYCGLYGLRPTVGRVPETGVWPGGRASGYADLTCVGPMARSARDAALLLSVIAGPDDVDPFAPPVPLRTADGVDVAGLRVRFYTHDDVAEPTHATRDAVRAAAQVLADRGASVEEAPPPDVSDATELFFGATGAEGGHDLLRHIEGSEGHHSSQFAAFLASMQLREPSASDYFTHLERLHGFRARLRGWLSATDVLLCPVVAGPAPRHGTPPAGFPQDEYLEYRAFSYTCAMSLAGVPAMSVPMSSEGGLPLGVQVVAGAWREDVVLAVAAALEQSTGEWRPASV